MESPTPSIRPTRRLPDVRFLKTVMIITIIVYLGGAAGLTYAYLQLQSETMSAASRRRDAVELIGDVRLYDETLTMSARLFAATGDKKWESRYDRTELQLSESLKRLSALTSLTATETTSMANAELVRAERESVALATAGRMNDAMARLSTAEYQRDKTLYVTGMDQLAADIESESADAAATLNNKIQSTITALALMTLTEFLFLVWAFRGIVRHNDAIWAQVIHNARLSSLGEMSAGIAHEINNPLTIVMGASPLLRKHRDNPELFERRLDQIEKAAQRIDRIVGNLRRFARGEDVHRQKPVCSLNEITRDSMLFIESKSRRHATPIRLDLDGELPIRAEAVEIEQVLINLVNNAIDAVKSRADRWVRISARTEGERVIMRVTDSGTGIPADQLDRLFQPFFTTKAVGEGTGLGLSICRGILRSHGATIQVRGENPHTCFEIVFPRA